MTVDDAGQASVLVLFFPILALLLPQLLIKSVF